MCDIFSPTDGDQSIYYLSQLFSLVGNVLTQGGLALLSNMFDTFNTAVLSLGSLIIVYCTIVGTLVTAHEGKGHGRKNE